MKQEEFNQVICELAYQIHVKLGVRCDYNQFISALTNSMQYQPEHIQLMIKQSVIEINKRLNIEMNKE